MSEEVIKKINLAIKKILDKLKEQSQEINNMKHDIIENKNEIDYNYDKLEKRISGLGDFSIDDIEIPIPKPEIEPIPEPADQEIKEPEPDQEILIEKGKIAYPEFIIDEKTGEKKKFLKINRTTGEPIYQ